MNGVYGFYVILEIPSLMNQSFEIVVNAQRNYHYPSWSMWKSGPPNLYIYTHSCRLDADFGI